MKRLTTEEFIKKAREIHGNKYDYSKVIYVNNRTKVCIICPIHGEFWQTPSSHLSGKGCRNCAKAASSKRQHDTTETFIQKARKVHGNKYDYSKVVYINSKTKVCIICPIHGEFWQTPNDHLNGCGCKKCGIESHRIKNSLTQEGFINQAVQVHGDRYDYSETKYINSHTKITVKCPIHGEFQIMPYAHLNGVGCSKCLGYHKSNEDIIKEFKKIHGDLYDYSKVEYINAHTKVCIICPIHGEFWQTPINHLNGVGCPICKESKLEKEVKNILKENSISFIQQYRNKEILGKQSLDFYVPSINLGVECQGIQHFEDVSFGSHRKDVNLKTVQQRDILKIQKCKENNIKLIHYVPFEKYFGTYENEVHNIEELKKLLTKISIL